MNKNHFRTHPTSYQSTTFEAMNVLFPPPPTPALLRILIYLIRRRKPNRFPRRPLLLVLPIVYRYNPGRPEIGFLLLSSETMLFEVRFEGAKRGDIEGFVGLQGSRVHTRASERVHND